MTIVTLRPTGGGAPAVTFETGGAVGSDLLGAPHDIVISPNGRYAVVRSELEIGVYELTGGAGPHQLFIAQPTAAPGPFLNSAMDSIEATNDRIVTISRNTNVLIPGGTQVDVLTYVGAHHHARMAGQPHDLAIVR